MNRSLGIHVAPGDSLRCGFCREDTSENAFLFLTLYSLNVCFKCKVLNMKNVPRKSECNTCYL